MPTTLFSLSVCKTDDVGTAAMLLAANEPYEHRYITLVESRGRTAIYPCISTSSEHCVEKIFEDIQVYAHSWSLSLQESWAVGDTLTFTIINTSNDYGKTIIAAQRIWDSIVSAKGYQGVYFRRPMAARETMHTMGTDPTGMPITGPRGVYTIVCKDNGRSYIGSVSGRSFLRPMSLDYPGWTPDERWEEHQRLLGLHQHHTWDMQLDWERYGPFAFDWSMVEECDSNISVESVEQRVWDKAMQNGERVWNQSPRKFYPGWDDAHDPKWLPRLFQRLIDNDRLDGSMLLSC
jgi:hypothetical protein